MSLFAPSGPSTQAPRVAPPPRPSSRSEQLLRNTLRRDDAIRSRASTASSYDDDDCGCENLDALLSRHRRNSAASASSASGQPSRNTRTVYTVNDDEEYEYAQLVRSNSAGSNHSRRPAYRSRQSMPEDMSHSRKSSRSHPDEDQFGDSSFASAQLHSRLTRVLRNPQQERSESSPPSSPRSFLNSRSNSRGTIESDSTGITVPEEICPDTLPSRHRSARSYSSVDAYVPSRGLSPARSQLRTPRSQWRTVPLPPSPSSPPRRLPSVSPASKQRPAVPDTFSARPHLHTRAQPHATPAEEFDAQTALLACRDLTGYVSFASVAGLGVPADLDMAESPIEQRSQPWVMRVMRSVF